MSRFPIYELRPEISPFVKSPASTGRNVLLGADGEGHCSMQPCVKEQGCSRVLAEVDQ
jgi:hypothetical protein